MKTKQMLRALVSHILLLSAFLAGANATAADFSWSRREVDAPSLVIKGEIKSGDYLRLIREIAIDGQNGAKFLLEGRNVIVTSPGGSLDDAIEMAKLFRDIYANVAAIGQCSSACFFLLAGATERFIMADVGLHNPYLSQAVAADMAVKPLEAALKVAELKSRQVLKDFGVPNHLVDKMLSHTSAEVYRPTFQDFLDFGQYSSSWNQIRVSKCDADSVYERGEYRQMLLMFSGSIPIPTQTASAEAYSRYKKMIAKCENAWVRKTAVGAALAHMKRNPAYETIR